MNKRNGQWPTPSGESRTALAANSLKTDCPAGHAYEGWNFMIDCRGHRACRTCRHAYMREYRSSGGSDEVVDTWEGQ